MTDPTVTIAGETFTVKAMTDGQIESLFRIQRSLSAAGDNSASFYGRQIARMGDLINGVLISEEDIDRLDRLYLAGKASTSEMMNLLFAAYRAAENPAGAVPAVVKKKPAIAVTKKAPVKKAVRGAK